VHSVLDRASEALPVAALVEQLPGIGRQRVSVVLHLLRDHRLARADRKRLWRVARRNEAAGQEAPGSADAVLFERLAAEYEERAGRDHEALERMVFYAQTGFCRWRVLLEYFDEPLPFEREHCGKCDNCLRLQAAASAPASEPTGEFRGPEGRSREAPEQIRWRPQDEVRVPRYGTGRVEQASIDEVEVRFADGSSRRFVASYVQPAAGLSMPDEVAQRVGDA
jgi:ATP-dependent DNA helicase RecQ